MFYSLVPVELYHRYRRINCFDNYSEHRGETEVSIVRLPAGFWDGPVRAGLSDDPVRLDGLSGLTTLT